MTDYGLLLEPNKVYDSKTLNGLEKTKKDAFVKYVEKPETETGEEGIAVPKGVKKRTIAPPIGNGAKPMYDMEDFDATANPGVIHEFKPRKGEPIKQASEDLPDKE